MASTDFRPFAFFETPTLGRDARVAHVRVILAEGRHEVAEVTVHYAIPRGVALDVWAASSSLVMPEETPVTLRWGKNSDNERRLYGYVSSKTVSGVVGNLAVQDGVVVSVTYTLLGTSMPMQSQQNRSWPAATGSYVARSVVRSHYLRPMVQKHEKVLSRAQTTQSDFRFLAALSAEIGYRLVVDQEAVYLTDPRVSLVDHSDIAAFVMSQQPGVRDTLQSFTFTEGTVDPRGDARVRRETYSYNPYTRTVARRADGVGSRVRTYAADRSSRSQSDALYRLSSQQRSDILWVGAAAIVDGDVRVRPGVPVSLHGNALGLGHEGLWMVRSCEHCLALHPTGQQLSTYQVTAALGRTRVDGLDLVDSRVALPRAKRGVTLIDGRWRAMDLGAV